MNFLSDQLSLSRSSHRRCFVRKGVLRNFVKLTGRQLCKSLYFNKVACRLVTLLKKRLRQRCFPVNFAKFLRTAFLQNTFGRLLLLVNTNWSLFLYFIYNSAWYNNFLFKQIQWKWWSSPNMSKYVKKIKK